MATLQPGATVGGRYELRREIARGGMGSVWEALHTQLEALVAIKFMDPSLCADDVARERFVREARAAAQIQSPHVVHISDYGVDGQPYIVMELLSGEDLDERLLRGHLSLEEAEQMVVQAAKGLRKAHEAGIVHRDLKPSNLFLAGDPHDWVVKLVDFGVAKAAQAVELPGPASAPGDAEGQLPSAMPRPRRTSNAEVTHTGMVLGSPQYMSPEQARGFKEVDHTADVWALATIAFRAVTGRRLFEGKETMQVLTNLLYEPLPVPSQTAPELPPPLQRFFDRALHPDPQVRFHEAAALSEAFRAACYQVRQQQDLGSIPGTAIPGPPHAPVSYPGMLDSSGMVPRMDPALVSASLETSGLVPRMDPALLGPPPAPRPTWVPMVAIGVAVLGIGSMSVVGVIASSQSDGLAARARADLPAHLAELGARVASLEPEEPPAKDAPDEGAKARVEKAEEDAPSKPAAEKPAPPRPDANRWGF